MIKFYYKYANVKTQVETPEIESINVEVNKNIGSKDQIFIKKFNKLLKKNYEKICKTQNDIYLCSSPLFSIVEESKILKFLFKNEEIIEYINFIYYSLKEIEFSKSVVQFLYFDYLYLIEFIKKNLSKPKKKKIIKIPFEFKSDINTSEKIERPIPYSFYCPLSNSKLMMSDPYITSNGNSYEKNNLLEILKKHIYRDGNLSEDFKEKNLELWLNLSGNIKGFKETFKKNNPDDNIEYEEYVFNELKNRNVLKENTALKIYIDFIKNNPFLSIEDLLKNQNLHVFEKIDKLFINKNDGDLHYSKKTLGEEITNQLQLNHELTLIETDFSNNPNEITYIQNKAICDMIEDLNCLRELIKTETFSIVWYSVNEKKKNLKNYYDLLKPPPHLINKIQSEGNSNINLSFNGGGKNKVSKKKNKNKNKKKRKTLKKKNFKR